MSLLVLSQAVIVPATQEDRQEQTSDEADDQQVVAPNIAVATAAPQINLGYQSYLVEEIFASEETSLGTHVASWFIAPAKKALKILFRQIISPNAP